MKYNKSLLYLGTLVNYEVSQAGSYKRAYSLQRIKRLLSLLGDPQDGFLSVIIAGTKGKGSTAAMLGSIASESGIKTGVYTSPHLISVTERIRIGEREISKQDFSRIIFRIKKVSEKNNIKGLTFFEAVTAAAFVYFFENNIRLAVAEVGLGGRLDATNVLKAKVAIITHISHDHTHLLGSSLGAIANEKAQVIKKGAYAVSALQTNPVSKVIADRCRDMKAAITVVGRDIDVSNIRLSLGGTTFDIRSGIINYKNLYTPLAGRQQAHNAALAVSAAEILKNRFGFNITKESIKKGLRKTKIEARFQVVSRDPYIVIDGAHNPASAMRLKDTLCELFPKKDIILVTGISSDKDIYKTIKPLCMIADKVIFTNFNSTRAKDPCYLACRLNRFCKEGYVAHRVSDAFLFAEALAGKKSVIVIAGSFFLAADAMRYYR